MVPALPCYNAFAFRRPAGTPASGSPPRRCGRPAQHSVQQHETHHRTSRPPEGAGSCAERRRAAQHHPDPLERADARRERAAGADRDRHGSRNRRARAGPRSTATAAPPRRRTRSTTSSASCAKAPRSSWKPLGRRNEMVLRSGRSTFTLACLPPEDYPVMSAGELPHHFALSVAELRTLIDRTRFAISTEETRYYLNGIYLHATQEQRGAGGARRRDRRPSPGAGRDHRARRARPACRAIIVPRKTVLELRKLVDEARRRTSPDRARRHQDPLRDRRGVADLEADRRHLPRLRSRHPGQQRQDPRSRVQVRSPKRSTACRRSRPSAAAPSSWRSSKRQP